jgi:hypothetical protein
LCTYLSGNHPQFKNGRKIWVTFTKATIHICCDHEPRERLSLSTLFAGFFVGHENTSKSMSLKVLNKALSSVCFDTPCSCAVTMPVSTAAAFLVAIFKRN